ncbi:MAG: hypothetical protein WBM54_10965 [Woeseia sp.]
MDATVVQDIRNEDGTTTSWTYRKEILQEDASEGSEAPTFPPPTGAANLLNQRALNAWNSGDIRGALELFENAIAADPNDPEPHSNYGRRLTVMAAHDKALPLLQRASELQPDNPQVWLDLLTAYETMLQFQRADEARLKARSLAGDRAFVRNEQGAWRLEGSSLP